eukprot:TRINITY_DN24607_c0_g1_i1.p1 TRINITY_DN24607_c0_g1~~TRINITY_DN24607_c0_g1_i1.p1  ORF type:complete len:137 (-),score=27.68 TRINITY_DN24607_c0_g1_i1:52-462(-)
MKGLLLVVLLACVFGVFGQQASPVPPPEGSDIDCTMCKFLVTELDYFLLNNATFKDMVYYLNATCNLPIFKEYRTVCDKIVSVGFVEFIILVEATQTPTAVCVHELDVCTSADSHNDSRIKELLKSRFAKAAQHQA